MNSYIVIPSNSIGGAEKRFFDIFISLLNLEKKSKCKLILPKSLFEKLKLQVKILPNQMENIITLAEEGDSLSKFCWCFKRWLNNNSKKGMHFHYPLNCLFPLHLGKSHSLSMSVTNCYNTPTLLTLSRSMLRQWITMFFVERIDVLNSNVMENLKLSPVIDKNKISLTPGGTFAEPSAYSIADKEPKVTFLSRLIQGKGVDEFLHILPEIWSHLESHVSSQFSFCMYGDGPLSELVTESVSNLSEQGIPVKYMGFVPSKDALANSMIVLSLQKVTNYPSRVVAEATLCGGHAIIRDSGDSRLFGEEDISMSYVSSNLDAKEIADKILKQLQLNFNDNETSKRIREKGIERFSSGTVIDYFSKLIMPFK